MKRFELSLRNIGSKYSFMKKNICILIFIYTVAISAIIRANFNYIDDLGRVRTGNVGWGYWGRYINCVLALVLHADGYLTDISPLPQFLAIVILAVSGSIVIYVVTKKQSFNLWSLIAVIPFGLSPYFLECLSYKYDSPYMALSVLASVFPFLFWEYGVWKYLIATVVGILAMCMTYQASSGIYLMIVIMLCAQRINKRNGGVKFALFSFAGYILALLIFIVFFMNPIDGYVSNSIASIGQMVSHLVKYYIYVYNDFKKWWLVLAGLMGIAYLYVSVRDTLRKKWCAFLLACLTLLLMGIVSFGVYPVLALPLYCPRAMCGFCAFIALIGISISDAEKTPLSKLICLTLAWVFFVFSFTYGNALAEQKRYTDFRVNAVIEDINDLEIFNADTVKTVQITGNIGKSPILNQQPQNYQILDRLVPTTFGGGWDWNEYYFYQYFSLKNVLRDPSIDLQEYDLSVLVDTMYHTIRGNGQYVLIEIKQ